MRKLRVFVLLLASVTTGIGVGVTSSCHGYVIHPGAVNVADSKLYDALIDVQAAIEEAKLQAV